jgi:hypothetical protein
LHLLRKIWSLDNHASNGSAVPLNGPWHVVKDRLRNVAERFTGTREAGESGEALICIFEGRGSLVVRRWLGISANAVRAEISTYCHQGLYRESEQRGGGHFRSHSDTLEFLLEIYTENEAANCVGSKDQGSSVMLVWP